jgi:hypothetical protein
LTQIGHFHGAIVAKIEIVDLGSVTVYSLNCSAIPALVIREECQTRFAFEDGEIIFVGERGIEDKFINKIRDEFQ